MRSSTVKELSFRTATGVCKRIMSDRNSSKTDVVAKDSNWRRRVDQEIYAQRNYGNQHGYMLSYMQGGAAREADSLDAFAVTSKSLAASYDGNLGSIYNMRASHPRFGNTVDRIVGLSCLDGHGKHKPVSKSADSDSLESFIESYLKRKPGMPRPAPRDMYAVPMLSSHKVGWRKSLETCNTGGFRLR